MQFVLDVRNHLNDGLSILVAGTRRHAVNNRFQAQSFQEMQLIYLDGRLAHRPDLVRDELAAQPLADVIDRRISSQGHQPRGKSRPALVGVQLPAVQIGQNVDVDVPDLFAIEHVAGDDCVEKAGVAIYKSVPGGQGAPLNGLDQFEVFFVSPVLRVQRVQP